MCAGTFGTAFPLLILEIIEHVGDTTGECQHDHEESDQEHHHVLHHCVDAEDDGPEVLGCNPDLDDFDDCEGKSNPPEYSPSRAEARYLTATSTDDVIHYLYDQSNHEEKVHHNVVVVPECKISLLESLLIGTWSFQSPEEKRLCFV